MHSVRSIYLPLLTRPRATTFYGGATFHRLKHLDRSYWPSHTGSFGGGAKFGRKLRHSDLTKSRFSSDLDLAKLLDHYKMEVCLHSTNMPLCHNISDNIESSSDLGNPTENLSRGLLMNDLKLCFTESLVIEDFRIPSDDLNPSPQSNVVREHESKDLDKRKPSNSVSETFSNYTAFPALGEPESSDGLLVGENWQEGHKASKINGCPKSADKGCSRRMSLHIPLKLVSAVRGSREMQGSVPKKLSVSWATDVYDPIPAAESHVPSSKNRHYRNSSKKYRRNKHKSVEKSSGGSRPKDKTRKNERSTMKHKPLHYDNIIVANIGEW